MGTSAIIAARPAVFPMLMERGPAPSEESSIALLTGKLADGDEQAFCDFHAQYFDRLFRYHLVIARGNEEMAREALQETFTRVARKPKRFQREDAFWSWLTLVARCAAIDAGRRRQRYWIVLRDYALSWLRPDHAPLAESEPGLHEFLELGLASLDCADRDLVEAKYFGGATVRDLARQSGVTEKAIESRLLRLRGKLREHILQSLRHERSS